MLSRYVELDKELLELNFEQEGEQVALMLSIPVIRAKDEEEIEAALKEEAEKLAEKAEELETSSEEEEEDVSDSVESDEDTKVVSAPEGINANKQTEEVKEECHSEN